MSLSPKGFFPPWMCTLIDELNRTVGRGRGGKEEAAVGSSSGLRGCVDLLLGSMKIVDGVNSGSVVIVVIVVLPLPDAELLSKVSSGRTLEITS